MGWNDSKFRGVDLPVETVTWFDCIEYGNRRSLREGLTPAYALSGATRGGNHITAATVTRDQGSHGYRLPTEAESEYACRAGTTTSFSTGPCLSATQANYDADHPYESCGKGESRQTTVPVGSLLANSWGLHEMHGNGWEWCWDWYGSYGDTTDPTGPASGSNRLERCGSWYSYAPYCRAAIRRSTHPGYMYCTLGLRVSRTVP
jgi:formylglycine-generating enzyme required for sulfatase activity